MKSPVLGDVPIFSYGGWLALGASVATVVVAPRILTILPQQQTAALVSPAVARQQGHLGQTVETATCIEM